MKDFKQWFDEQFEKKKVEPNSGLGHAIKSMCNHWDALTLFLRQPGAPLDNNVCERALKKAILNRKNALFYKTERGARVGDLYMSRSPMRKKICLCTLAERTQSLAGWHLKMS